MERPLIAVALALFATAAVGEEQWLVLHGLKGPHERVLSVRPSVPSVAIRTEFPIQVSYCKPFRAAANGLPADHAELRGLYEHEQRLRALDPKEETFLQALRETSNGRRCWTHYTKDADAFRKLLAVAPGSANIAPEFKTDQNWGVLSGVLAKTRR